MRNSADNHPEFSRKQIFNINSLFLHKKVILRLTQATIFASFGVELYRHRFMSFSSTQKLLLVLLLAPVLLVMSCANICRCVEDDCLAPIAALGSEHEQHGHSHHHHHGSTQDGDDTNSHRCDHSAEPIVQAELSTTPVFLPLVMIYVEYLGLCSLEIPQEDIAPLMHAPPQERRVLIEPYRPLLI